MLFTPLNNSLEHYTLNVSGCFPQCSDDISFSYVQAWNLNALVFKMFVTYAVIQYIYSAVKLLLQERIKKDWINIIIGQIYADYGLRMSKYLQWTINMCKMLMSKCWMFMWFIIKNGAESIMVWGVLWYGQFCWVTVSPGALSIIALLELEIFDKAPKIFGLFTPKIHTHTHSWTQK